MLNNKSCHFDLKKSTRLNQDKCFLDAKTKQSLTHGYYNIQNYNDKQCAIPNVKCIADQQPDLYYKDGYGSVGMNGCIVDADSMAKNGILMTNMRCKNQLFEPPYLTTPYMARGLGDSCIEDSLLEGEDTSQKRQCNTLSEITIDNFFTPLMPSVKSSQEPKHLVQEMSDKGWVRGGVPSRQIIRNINYKYK